MAWINGLERKRFNEEQKRLAEQYRAAGMTEEQIEQMYQFELITLYVFDDLTQNEIGVRFGISQKAVSKRIEQIRKHLNKFS